MKNRSLLILMLIACLTLIVTQVSAQDTTPIAPGETINGTLTADTGGELFYTFSRAAGTPVVILMTSNDFDSYLVLLDPNGDVVAEDDDSGGRLNAQITYTLASDGQHTIIATSLRAYRSGGQFAATGNFALTLTIVAEQPVPTVTPPSTTLTPPPPTRTPTPDFSPTPIPTVVPATPPPTAVVPSEIGIITFGQNISAFIPADFSQQQYRFSANAGEMVEITLISSDFDAYLFLYDASGVIVAQDDDGAGGTNSRILYTIPATGDYIIGVDSFGNVVGINPGNGTFSLSLTLQDGGIGIEPIETITVPLEIPTDNTLTINSMVRGRVSAENPEVNFAFEGEVGQIVTFSLRSEDLDTYLILRDTDGNVIAENDDSGGTLNSRIGPIQLTADGEYTVVATTYNYTFGGGSPTGIFELSAAEIIPTMIEYDAVVEGFLSLDSANLNEAYGFEGTAGDVVTLDLSTFSYALYLQLIGPNGTVNQSTGGGNALLGPIVLPEDGLYVVVLDSYDLYESVDYTFTVKAIQPLEIAYGEPATNTISADDSVFVYTFEGSLGDALDIVVNSNGAVDTRMTLTSPSGTVIASDDDSGTGFDPEILGIILTENGTYALLVQPYIRGDVGEFDVLVAQSTSIALDEAALTIRLSDKQFRGVGIFEATAGETVLLSIRMITGAENQPYVTVTQGETVLALQSIGTVKRLLIELEIPEDGIVQVSVEDYSYAGTIIEFSVER